MSGDDVCLMIDDGDYGDVVDDDDVVYDGCDGDADDGD